MFLGQVIFRNPTMSQVYLHDILHLQKPNGISFGFFVILSSILRHLFEILFGNCSGRYLLVMSLFMSTRCCVSEMFKNLTRCTYFLQSKKKDKQLDVIFCKPLTFLKSST